MPARPSNGSSRSLLSSCLHFSPPAVLFTKNRKDFEVADGHGGRVALGGLVVESL